MPLAIVGSMPIERHFVPSCLESIIDRKIVGIALNIFLKTIDWIFSWIYPPYHALFLKKMARVHCFSDKTVKLYDLTRQKLGGVDQDFVTLRKKRVYFNPNPQIETVFSRQAFTHYIVIKDARQNGYVEIIEQEISRPENRIPMEKSWLVNGNLLMQIGQQDSYLGIVKPSFLASPREKAVAKMG